MTDLAVRFEPERRRLLGPAYRMCSCFAPVPVWSTSAIDRVWRNVTGSC
jgi:hypothetical protein